MQLLLILSLVVVVILWVRITRRRRDQRLIADQVSTAGGQFGRAIPVKMGSPFPDTGRGWWAWRVEYHAGGLDRIAWALTTRDGLKEWRDDS
jgi:hypothetical protein